MANLRRRRDAQNSPSATSAAGGGSGGGDIDATATADVAAAADAAAPNTVDAGVAGGIGPTPCAAATPTSPAVAPAGGGGCATAADAPRGTDEPLESFLERTCAWCKLGGGVAAAAEEGAFNEHQLHCDGIWLHASRYSCSARGWSYETARPMWAQISS